MRMAVAAGALAWLTGAVHGGANLLVNGDLETPPLDDPNLAFGWTLVEPDVDGAGGAVNSADFERFANHTPGGDRGLWFRSFEGNIVGDLPLTVDADLHQTVVGTPGTHYTLSAWFRMEPNYSGLDPLAPTATVLTLEFLGAGFVLIGAAQLDVDAVYVPDNTWQQVSVAAIAPAGTAFVRVHASMFDGVIADENPQSAFVDDFVLVPAPGALALLGIAALARRRRRGS